MISDRFPFLKLENVYGTSYRYYTQIFVHVFPNIMWYKYLARAFQMGIS